MGDTPTTVNKPAQTVNEIIDFAIYTLAVNAGMTALIAEVPFFGLPIIKQLTQAAFKYVAGYVYKFLAEYATFAVIDLQTAVEKSAYAKAEGDLRAAHLTGDPNAIQAATDNFKKTLASLIHWDGSSTP